MDGAADIEARDVRAIRCWETLQQATQDPLQRAACRAHPVPTLAGRRADLAQLKAFLLAHQDALCDAISADYGHRSRHETLLAEIFPAIDGIDDATRYRITCGAFLDLFPEVGPPPALAA